MIVFDTKKVMYVCHHSDPIRSHMKDESSSNQESARSYCEFYFKIKYNTKLNKLFYEESKFNS